MIADARDNRITLDFMRDPKIGLNPIVRKIVGLLTGFVTLDSANHIVTSREPAWAAMMQAEFLRAASGR